MGNSFRATRSTPRVQNGERKAAREMLAFLLGSGPLDGCWFGDRHPTERGAFWWRKHLRALSGDTALVYDKARRTIITKQDADVAGAEQVRSDEVASEPSPLPTREKVLREALEEAAKALEDAAAAICEWDRHDPAVAAQCNLAYRKICVALATEGEVE